MNAPLPPMGVKQWSTKLTAIQRDVLAALPTGAANRKSVTEGHQALDRAFREHIALRVPTLAIAWPDDLEEATDRYLASHGVEIGE